MDLGGGRKTGIGGATEATAGTGGAEEGEHWVLMGLQRLPRQEYVGAFSVHSNAGGDLDLRTRVSTWALNPRPTSVRNYQTVTMLKRLSCPGETDDWCSIGGAQCSAVWRAVWRLFRVGVTFAITGTNTNTAT